MIEIIDQLIDIGRDTFGKCYRAYPMKVLRDTTYAVISEIGRTDMLMEHGVVVQSMVTYGVTIYSQSPEKVQDLTELYTDKLNSLGIQSIGCSSMYVVDNYVYSANMTYNAIVDKRGHVFRG